MTFKDFSSMLKNDASKLKDGKILVSYIDNNITEIRKRYNFDLRRLDLLLKPLFVQYNLFAEYALNDEISQILGVSKYIIQNSDIDIKKIKKLKNKIIDKYKKSEIFTKEENLSKLGRWARIEGKISELSNSPRIFSLLFGFNNIDFFISKILKDSNYLEQYLEIFLKYYNYENFEKESFDFQDCIVIEEQLARLSYGHKVWIYEVFSPFIKSVFSVLDTISNGKELHKDWLEHSNDLIIWNIMDNVDTGFIKEKMYSSVNYLSDNSKINYEIRNYNFDKAEINSQIKYFSDVKKMRNNIEHTNPIFELLKNIDDIKSINRKSPKLLSDIDLIEYLPDVNMVKLRIDSFIDGLNLDFNPSLNEIYTDLMIDSVDNLLGWYAPPKLDIDSYVRRNINGKNTKNT